MIADRLQSAEAQGARARAAAIGVTLRIARRSPQIGAVVSGGLGRAARADGKRDGRARICAVLSETRQHCERSRLCRHALAFWSVCHRTERDRWMGSGEKMK